MRPSRTVVCSAGGRSHLTLAALAAAQDKAATHIVPFFPAASDDRREGLVSIVNFADEPGAVDIVAVNAAGTRFEGGKPGD